MNVLVVEPGYAPYEKEIESEQDIESLVGSSFEIFYPAESNPDDGVIGIRNPEAEEQGLPFNRRIDNYFRGAYGTFFSAALIAEIMDGFPLPRSKSEDSRPNFKRPKFSSMERTQVPVISISL